MSDKRPLILITNDDGYDAPGIELLTRVALDYGDVVVAAPATAQSGKASAITLDRPLRPRLVEKSERLTRWIIDGTPADCAKLALSQLLDGRRADMVLAGVNHGYNTGISALYSGTMGATFEGLIHGATSVAFSYGEFGRDIPIGVCEPAIRHIVERVMQHGLPPGVCLNVNVPPASKGPFKGYKATTSAPGRWCQEFERRVHPHGGEYFWMAGYYDAYDPDDTTTDLYWLDRGWVSVNPCHIDQTDHPTLALLTDIL